MFKLKYLNDVLPISFGTGFKRLITDGLVLHVGRVPGSNPHLHASMGADRPFDTIIITELLSLRHLFLSYDSHIL